MGAPYPPQRSDHLGAVASAATPSGEARLHVEGDAGAPARLVLGHGAGGGLDTPDLRAARDAGLALGLQVVGVEQPWRVRGRRVAEPPARLDAAWLAALSVLPPRPAVLGGRSAGARVACRTAPTVADVRGVLCLAFPLRPPAGGPDRAAELALPAVPRLVVQGERDAFGVPEPAAGLQVVVLPGADHSFRVRRRDGTSAAEVRGRIREAVRRWLTEVLEARAGQGPT